MKQKFQYSIKLRSFDDYRNNIKLQLFDN